MKTQLTIFSFLLILFSFSCTEKELVNVYVLDELSAESPGIKKSNLKTDIEFISIAYSDLFDTQITLEEMNLLNEAYKSLGDNDIIIERFIKTLLKNENLVKPSEIVMRNDVKTFVTDTYNRFLSRAPDEMELWFWEAEIRKDVTITVEQIYFIFLTSEEYKYY